MTHEADNPESTTLDLRFIPAIIFAAMAGGMAWGIRGQYGHETGAMMAGILVSLALILVLRVQGTPMQIARAVAMATVAMGLGGSMTYAQTVGLTQNPEVLGNADAWRWGMVGLAVKGAAWIGFGGAFLGIGLGGVRYRWWEMGLLMIGMVVMAYIGTWLLNTPFDLESKKLPAIYFSETWDWAPDKENIKPRREIWGGLWIALITLILYVGVVRRDELGARMAGWGIAGGAIGFPFGQSLQSFNAWHREEMATTFLVQNIPSINWWNFMETGFGAIMGAILGLGLWLHRRRISLVREDFEIMPSSIEQIFFALHVLMLVMVEFAAYKYVDMFYDFGLIMAILPMMLIVGGRNYPFLQIFPIILMPIAGKTLRNLGYERELVSIPEGWIGYVVFPLLLATVIAILYAQRPRDVGDGQRLARVAIMFGGWAFFILNWHFFESPWPWDPWTGRTPNGIVFAICIAGLTGLTIYNAMTTKNPNTEPQND